MDGPSASGGQTGFLSGVDGWGTKLARRKFPHLAAGLLWPFATAAELRGRRRQVLPQKAAAGRPAGISALGHRTKPLAL